MKNDRNIFSFELPIEVRQSLQLEADEKELTLAGLIRYILKQYIKDKNNGKGGDIK